MADSLLRYGINQLNHKLKVKKGGIEVTNGNISGSSTSTGSFGKLEVAGNSTLTGDLTLGGNIQIGDADSDSITINADLTSNLIPNADNTYDIGSSAKQWKDIYVNGIGYIDQLGTDGDPVAIYVNSGELDGVTIGGESAAAGTFTSVTATGTISGSAVYGTTIGQNRTDGVKTITIEANSAVNQDLTTDASPTFAGITSSGDIVAEGDVIAQNYIVSSSVTYMTSSIMSGSTRFGDSIDDTHIFSGSLFITGSNHISGTLNVQAEGVYSSSTAIITNNISNGFPTSNPWGASLEGSYFNNFDNTTNVSEILRFMSGVMSHSLDVADASPNTKTWSSLSTTENNLGTTDSVDGRLPQS